jgi:hypothetical protein
MYFNLRVAEIKVAVEKQNRVLTAFITNVQQDIRSGGGVMPVPFGVGMNHLAAPEALIAAQKFGNDKIVVSDDDESDEDESDEDSDDETDDDSDSVTDDEEDEKAIAPVVSIQEITFEAPIPISFEVLSSVATIESDNEKAFESSITEIIDVSAGLVDTGLVDTSVVDTSVVDTSVMDTSLIDATAYEQMKVDELRKIATDKNLAPKEEVRKLKKPELLLLLKK